MGKHETWSAAGQIRHGVRAELEHENSGSREVTGQVAGCPWRIAVDLCYVAFAKKQLRDTIINPQCFVCSIFTMFSATHFLSPQRRAELRSAFNFFDKKRTGFLDLKTFVFLLKSIGAEISQRDLKAITSEYEERKEFSFEDLLLVAQVVYNDVAIERGVLRALREIAPPKAQSLALPVLRDYLLRLGMGIKLTQEEVDYFLNVACDPDESNTIDFETFIYRLLRD